MKTLVVIAGPTAVGKTAAAIGVAKALGTEILSADSRQCYQELNIGVARPSPEELAAVPHHFIASHSIFQELNAAAYEQYALGIADQVFQKHDFLVVGGGTGLYIKALCEGLDSIPPIPPELREELNGRYAAEGLPWLQAAVATEDPEFYAVGDIQNPHRLLRALEVIRGTGRPIISYRTGAAAQRPFRVVKVALDLPRAVLYERINRRVEAMMDAGLETEARALYPHRDLNALQTVGYKELFEYFDGKLSRDAAVNAIQTNTRHYAKRQLTWFRKDAAFRWLHADNPDLLKEIIQGLD